MKKVFLLCGASAWTDVHEQYLPLLSVGVDIKTRNNLLPGVNTTAALERMITEADLVIVFVSADMLLADDFCLFSKLKEEGKVKEYLFVLQNYCAFKLVITDEDVMFAQKPLAAYSGAAKKAKQVMAIAQKIQEL